MRRSSRSRSWSMSRRLLGRWIVVGCRRGNGMDGSNGRRAGNGGIVVVIVIVIVVGSSRRSRSSGSRGRVMAGRSI